MTASWAAHLEDPGAFDVSGLSGDDGLPGVWAARWAERPSTPVLRVAEPGGRWSTAGELEEATRRAAVRLAAAGLHRGERMVWSCDPGPAGVVALLGALRLGAVVVPVNPAYTERELGHVVGDVRPTVAVVGREEQARWVAAASAAGAGAGGVSRCRAVDPELRRFDGVGTAAASGDGVTAASGDGAAAFLDRATADDPALVVYTSGTTGAPKGAVLSHGNLVAGARALALAWRWTPADRLVLALPLFHVHGLCAGLLGTLCAGASAVLLPRFSPGALTEAAGAHGASLFFGVPTMYHRLLESGRAGELGALRLCVSGSAPLPVPAAEAMAAAGVRVLERYGMTETLLTVSNPYAGERRPGSIGFALPGVQTTLDPLAADRAADGEGQLLVAGPSVFSGYWERPAATEAAFEDGWFRTGDVVASDADGYLRVRGRRGDLILSGGFNVYPAEVEDVLLADPGVAEVAVVGEPSEEWGETVVAWIVPASEAPRIDSLEALAAERLAPYKRPRRYRTVDALPRNAMGKVQRDLLR